ncbi:glycosyltransferase family 2 protein [Streptomyces sp. NPDC056501]|uniref:glycosyltransferase family 2 protein n=1 Tax=Streptomyces sp. NPDC056501 TaxID=3345841 RepID=UPI0036C1C221
MSDSTSPHGFSVVICVYTEERWEDILAAVDSVKKQSLPPLETLLVVDHNERLLERLTEEYADERLHEEVRVLANAGPRGLSSGRNTGIAASRGAFVAFLDDDAVAERDWLHHFAAAYDGPEVMAVGGRTLPAWASGRRPAWFPEEFDWVVGCTYRGLPPGRVRVRNVLGGNASFRRTAFDAAGGFATGIGRDGDRRPLGCEETELCIRLAKALPGAILLIDDRAVIHHKVPAVRERFGYFRTRVYAEGLSKALVAQSVGAQKGLESERRYTTRVLPSGVLRGVGDALRGRSGGAGRAGAIVTGVTVAAGGYALGTLRARRGGPAFSWGPIERTEDGTAKDATAKDSTAQDSTARDSTAKGNEPKGSTAQEGPPQVPAEKVPAAKGSTPEGAAP